MKQKTLKEIQIKSHERMKKHGEVLTASKEVEAMLDLVNEECKNPDKIFFEPACGDGNFLISILRRKLIYLIFSSQTDFENSILSVLKSIYGTDLLEDNIKTAQNRMLEQTINYYKSVLHTNPDRIFSDKAALIITKNIIKGDFLNNIKFKNLKINVIIGNPPYQIMDGGGTGDSAKPVYNKFIQKAKEYNPDYITMIIPSRWMKGGKGLNAFRQEMINDERIKIIHDFEDSKICFPELHIDGGICYFLWDKNYSGETEYHHYALDGNISITNRHLKTNLTNNVIRDYRQISIIEKAARYKEEKFSSIVYSRNPYGFYADLFNAPEHYPEIKISKSYIGDLYKIYGILGKKGGAKRVFGYVNPDTVKKNKAEAQNYKLFFSKAYTTTSTVPPEIILGKPGEVCTETFLQIGKFENAEIAENCLSYIKTKFFRALLFFNRHSLNISKKSFELIPVQDFSQKWNDEILYKKYNFEQKEIDFINSVIKPIS